MTKVIVRAGHGGEHQDDRQRVSDWPRQLGHELEIHAPDGPEKRRRKEHSGRDRQDANDLVLLDRDQTERSIEQEVDLARQERDMVLEGANVAADKLEAGTAAALT